MRPLWVHSDDVWQVAYRPRSPHAVGAISQNTHSSRHAIRQLTSIVRGYGLSPVEWAAIRSSRSPAESAHLSAHMSFSVMLLHWAVAWTLFFSVSLILLLEVQNSNPGGGIKDALRDQRASGARRAVKVSSSITSFDRNEVLTPYRGLVASPSVSPGVILESEISHLSWAK